MAGLSGPGAGACNRPEAVYSRRALTALDLRQLKQLHPRLPASNAVDLAYRASVALERNDHQPGCTLRILADDEPEEGAALEWAPSLRVGVEQLDVVRVTEDGAEAVALVVVGETQGWEVRKRLQRGEAADWLLTRRDGVRVAMEVSGAAGEVPSQRVTEKLRQAARASVCAHRVALVVGFGPPEAIPASVTEELS